MKALLALSVAIIPLFVPTATGILPPETPECNNQDRMRACVHVTLLDPVDCQVQFFFDFLFDDPFFATGFAGDFSWTSQVLIKWSNGTVVDNAHDNGDFTGIPLYPAFGLVKTAEDFRFLEPGQILTLTAIAYDDNALPIVGSYYSSAIFSFTCPTLDDNDNRP